MANVITGVQATSVTISTDESLIVGPDGFVADASQSVDTTAAVSMYSTASLLNYGIIAAGSSEALFVDTTSGFVNNTASGQIDSGGIGLRGLGDFTMLNAGRISGGSNAIDLSTFSSVYILNTGSIAGGEDGIGAYGAFAFLSVINQGDITGADFGIDGQGMSGTIYVNNAGTISGAAAAVHGVTATGNFTIYNDGLIDGQVLLGDGGDIVNTRHGELRGTVTLLGGDDRFVGGASGEEADGGNGEDRLRGFGGDDTLFGGAGYDTLEGNAGDDLLDGGGRSDILIGGMGDDTLTGGGGSDTFVIRRTLNGNDEVTDFQNGTDLVDLSSLGLSGFSDLQVEGIITNDTDSVTINLAALGGSGQIRLEGMSFGDLDASDFIF